MKKFIYILIPLFILSCADIGQEKVDSPLTKNSESDDITFIIDLKINPDTNEDLNLFVEEITQNVIDSEDFCLEYGYYVSEDQSSVTLYEKYIDSESAVKHGQNFMGGPFFERFFNLFTLEKFIVTGPASEEFKNFTQENGFVIEYRNSIDGFLR
tara:strand:+ start:558 stop:1022 length:465 start_codon:yes stop_codon:yes gene_type:complete